MPGIYRRHAKECARGPRCECAYVVIYENRKLTFPTLAEAREGKRLAQRRAKLSKAHERGVHASAPQEECPECGREAEDRETRRQEQDAARSQLHAYARAWVERYQGVGKRGFREETRDEYRGLLDRYALTFFPEDARLDEVTPKRISEFIGWLVEQPSGRGEGKLTDKTIRNVLGPLRACLATAKREGEIPENPAVGAALPHRPTVTDDEDLPRPFPRVELENEDGGTEMAETMELAVSLIPAQHRVMFELLAATGVRRSELLAFRVQDLDLNGAQPMVKIRQRTRAQKGKGQVIGPLKSRHARRDLPIPLELADRLRPLVLAKEPEALVFESPFGGPYDPAHLYTRVLQPACSEAGVEWAGFHTFRHTVASRMFAAGRNAVQVQHWLGHHSAAFTLSTYVHLLADDDLGGPLVPVAGGKKKARERPETAANASPGVSAKAA